MSDRKGTQRGPGGKATSKTRGVEGSGGARGRAPLFPPPPVWRTVPQPPPTTPTSGRSGAMKSARRDLFIGAAAGEPTARVRVVGDAGTGQGSAAQAAPPLGAVAAEAQWQEEEQPELPFELSFGDLSPSALKLTPTGQRLMGELEEGLDTQSTALVPSGSSSFAEGGKEGQAAVEQEEEVEGHPEVLPSQPLPTQASPSAPTSRHGVSAQSSSQEVAQEAAAAASRRGGQTSSFVWKHFQVSEVNPRIAQCQLCRAHVSRGRDLAHLSTSGLTNHLKRHHQALLLQGERQTAATGVPKRKTPGSLGVSRAAATTSSAPSALPQSSPRGEAGALALLCQKTIPELLGMAGTSVPRGGGGCSLQKTHPAPRVADGSRWVPLFNG